MIGPGRPLRFLLFVAVAWVGARAVVVWPEPGRPRLDLGPGLAYVDALADGAPAKAAVTLPDARDRRPAPMIDPAVRRRPTARRLAATGWALPAGAQRGAEVGAGDRTIISAPVGFTGPAAARSRLSLSTWGIVRDGGGDAALAGGGQLGGSQAGIRAAYALDAARSAALYGRVSAPLSGQGGREVAVGLDWQPARRVPVRVGVERRRSIGGGRNAFAVGVAGGVSAVPLPARFALDGYGQAGLVGLRRRDGYVDGAIRVERPLWQGRGVRLAIGAGAWGGIQPAAGRLDLGPQLVIRVPAGPTTLRLGIDWRQRVAGNARPGSGPALSVGADF